MAATLWQAVPSIGDLARPAGSCHTKALHVVAAEGFCIDPLHKCFRISPVLLIPSPYGPLVGS